MTFLWPGFLLLLALVPILIAFYIWVLRRRRRYAVRFSSLAIVRPALPRYSRLRRHLPFALFVLALAGLSIALARPVAIVSVPSDQTTIVLTLDVSGSMRSVDIPPSRLQAAKDAALSFIQRQGGHTRFAIVAFSGYAVEIQPPTTDQEALQIAIDSLTTGRSTAIGSGILKSIDAISEIDPSVPPSTDPSSGQAEPTPVIKGAYAPDIIVLLTDGVSNVGPLPTDAAQQAVNRGIRIYTIGFGTANGNVQDPGGRGFGGGGGDPFRRGGGQFGGGGGQFGGGGGGGFNGGGRRFGGFRAGIDEATLKQVASMTGGEYYSASSSGELNNVFESLPTYLITKHETTEITVGFAAIGALLAAFAVGLALLWHPLP